MDNQAGLLINIATTVMLVAAVVATIINLMGVGNKLQTTGQNKLQSGVALLEKQEFDKYNNVAHMGGTVKTTLQTYQDGTIALLVRTKAGGESTYYNYGALLEGTTKGTDSASGDYYTISATSLNREAGSPYYLMELKISNGIAHTNFNLKGIEALGNSQVITNGARYQSSIIKNKSNNIIGILFDEVG